MSHTINDRSKKILDILFKNNIDVSGLNILRKFAESWTREQAEATLVPGSEGVYDSGGVYALGTFFDRPNADNNPLQMRIFFRTFSSYASMGKAGFGGTDISPPNGVGFGSF